MSVVHISATLSNAPNVGIQSCVFGVECEVVEKTDPTNIVFELTGSDEKISQIVEKTLSRRISTVAKVRRV